MNYLRFLPIALILCSPQAHATLQAYWNMDDATLSGKLAANGGNQAGSVSASFINIDAGFDGGIDPNITGTSENIVGSSPTNRAAGFYRVGSVFADGEFRMNNFDFTGLSNGEVSFAVRGQNAFTWDTNLEVDYRLNDGSWVDVTEGLSYAANWNIASVGFGSALDDVADVDFRIRTESWVSGFGYLDIDNVQVNAVPEPAHFAAVAGLLALAALVYHRRRQ